MSVHWIIDCVCEAMLMCTACDGVHLVLLAGLPAQQLLSFLPYSQQAAMRVTHPSLARVYSDHCVQCSLCILARLGCVRLMTAAGCCVLLPIICRCSLHAAQWCVQV